EPPMEALTTVVQAAVQSQQPEEMFLPLSHFNPGSRGHPELCKRPCVYISGQGVCQLAGACEYCHYQHRKVKSLEKRQREILKNLGVGRILSVLLPHITTRAETAGLLQRINPLLRQIRAISTPNAPTDLRPVGRTLSRMPLAGLLALVQTLAPPDLAQAAQTTLEAMRAESATGQRR
ncbi:MTPC1, partial [Symbiodinium natans]